MANAFDRDSQRCRRSKASATLSKALQDPFRFQEEGEPMDAGIERFCFYGFPRKAIHSCGYDYEKPTRVADNRLRISKNFSMAEIHFTRPSSGYVPGNRFDRGRKDVPGISLSFRLVGGYGDEIGLDSGDFLPGRIAIAA